MYTCVDSLFITLSQLLYLATTLGGLVFMHEDKKVVLVCAKERSQSMGIS